MKKNKIITEPRVYLVGKQILDKDMLNAFLDDEGMAFKTDTEVPAEVIAEAAGRTCYMSFGKGRKTNAEYLDRIISSHHGSVLEHAVWNFLITGISRSLTHELIRHRAGWGYSQLSQRYVDESDAQFTHRGLHSSRPWVPGQRCRRRLGNTVAACAAAGADGWSPAWDLVCPG